MYTRALVSTRGVDLYYHTDRTADHTGSWVIKEYPSLDRVFFAEDMAYEYLTAIFYIAAGGWEMIKYH
ncbi:MAG: hypothetical protein R6U17_03535 [Thermoplasmata archaeon]